MNCHPPVTFDEEQWQSICEAAGRAGMSPFEYCNYLDRKITELEEWWKTLRETGYIPGESPLTYLHRLNTEMNRR
jgi:hypothetical protein